MRPGMHIVFIAFVLTAACGIFTPAPTPTPTEIPILPTDTATQAPDPDPGWPPVTGPEPSDRVAAFYYPWYGNPEVDGLWIHWDQAGYGPPEGIGSDFYPTLGAYSAMDPEVVAQHFDWLRKAGIGVIVSSWWGQGSHEDQVVPLLLDMGEHYGIRVAFHLEPYGGRSADRLVQDIAYLYDRYGGHPAFFRSTAPSRWSPDDRPKGLFYVWSSGFPDSDSPRVEPGYWRDALDRIHALPDGGLVLADENASEWVDGGHFDGLYNYGVLDLGLEAGYSFARGLPPDAWYVPGVNPGFSAIRIGYPANLDTPRRNGDTYVDRWESALSEGVEPALVTITTFNEWHEGTQIEPAAAGVPDSLGGAYLDYGVLPPEGYLMLTREWVDTFLAMSWPETQPIRIRLSTTSDWTEFSLLSGASWLRPALVTVSNQATHGGMVDGRIGLNQPIGLAEAGGEVELVVDLLYIGWEEGGNMVFEVQRGNLGSTRVEVSRFVEGDPVLIRVFEWAGLTGDGRNASTFQVTADAMFGPAP